MDARICTRAPARVADLLLLRIMSTMIHEFPESVNLARFLLPSPSSPRYFEEFLVTGSKLRLPLSPLRFSEEAVESPVSPEPKVPNRIRSPGERERGAFDAYYSPGFLLRRNSIRVIVLPGKLPISCGAGRYNDESASRILFSFPSRLPVRTVVRKLEIPLFWRIRFSAIKNIQRYFYFVSS